MIVLLRRAWSPAVLIAVMVSFLLVGCGRPPELVGIVNAAVPVDAVPEVRRHRVFITSTRAASEVVGAFYGPNRAPELGLSSVDVTVPPAHVTGQIERPRSLPPDPRTEFTVVDPRVYRTDQAFIAAIDRELASRPPGQRKIMIFVHGYNTTTSDALLLLGQFVNDTGYQGVPVLFTWASAARAPRYVYDLNSALVARVQVKEAADVLVGTRAEGVVIFAHSMGSFLTMEGLVDAQQTGFLGKRSTIEHIILASPDIDIDLFRTQAKLLPRSILERMYLIVSEDDYALRISRRLAGGVPRVGAADAAELEEIGVTVIDLSEIDDSATGSHSKFAGSPEVVQLIGSGLKNTNNLSTSTAPGLEQLVGDVPIRIFGQ